MMSEFVIGRRTGEDPVKAYPKLRPERPAWRFVGLAGLVTCFLILAIYLVISGWTFNYFWESLTGTLATIANDGFGDHFSSFASSTVRPVLFIVLFLAFTTWVIIGGVEKGIERVSKLLMPILVVRSFVDPRRSFCRCCLSVSTRFQQTDRRRGACRFGTGIVLALGGYGCYDSVRLLSACRRQYP